MMELHLVFSGALGGALAYVALVVLIIGRLRWR